MTVKELIKILQGYNEDFPVFMGGVEGAWNLQKISLARLQKNNSPEWKHGPHMLNNEEYDMEGVVIE